MSEHYDSNDRDDGTIDRCPFCKGEGIVDCQSPILRHSVYYFVRCTDCGAMTWLYCKTPQEALKRWNRRVK